MGVEALALLASPLFRGHDVPRGAGRPVLLIPGFMAGDGSLAVLNRWLRRQGFRVHASGISRNVECSEKAVARLSAKVREMSERYEQPVAIIGHSRGGTYGRVLAVRHPEHVDHVITLGSPLVATMDDFHPLLRLNIRTIQALQKLAGGTLIATDCEESWEAHKYGLEGVGCCYDFWADLDEDVPADVTFTSIYSRSDGVVHWRACLDPDAVHLEIDGSHCGMGLNAKVFRAIAEQLAPVQLRNVAPAPATVPAPAGAVVAG
jgi:pimeloyl-ACP methyl ester carboxylesterase